MLQRWRHGRRCLKEADRCRQPALTDYLRECAGLAVDRIDRTPLIAVDLELTGLDKRSERIVSLGWTLVDGGRIRLGSSRHLLFQSGSPVGQSAVVHGVLDRDLDHGVTIDAGLEALFTAARGRLWVMHHAGLDIAFLKAACANWAGCAPGFIVLDTMRIEYRLRRRREVPVKQGDLQLGRIRNLYGLPAYAAHNALSDAVAAAELMLAIAALIQGERPLDLAPWVKFF